MKLNHILLILSALLWCVPAQAQRFIPALPESSSVHDNDLFILDVDPPGPGQTKKLKASTLAAWIEDQLSIPAAQVQSDWNAVSGLGVILNKPTLFSGSYTDLTNKPSIPAAQVQSDWNAVSGLGVILNKPTLFSGSYTDLTNKPSIPAAQVQSDWNAVSGLGVILNKPTLFSGSYTDLTNKPTLGSLAALSAVTTTQITDGTVTNADISASAAIALSKLAIDPLARSNHTGTQAASTLTGAVAVVNGGTNQTTYTNGQLLIGNSTGNTLTKATLTAGTNISINNGAGSITVNLVGPVPASLGGTGQTNLAAALGAMLPSQSGHSGHQLTTDGAGTISWAAGSGGGGSTISQPHMIWVQTDGNDSTGDGTIAKPFASASAAYAAGIASSAYFVLRLGVGSFNLTLTAAWNSYCVAVVGEGNSPVMSGQPTFLAITATGPSVLDSNGIDGYGVSFAAHNCTIAVNTNGGNVTATDGGTYTAGHGGNVYIDGTACVSIDASGGGDSGSSNGAVQGGGGGNIYLKGHLQMPLSGVLLSMSPEGFNSNSQTGGGLVLIGVDASRASWISTTAGSGGTNGTLQAGNCAFPTGAPALDIDRGGNSTGW